MDDEYEHDGGLALYEARAKSGTKEQQMKRQKAAQVLLLIVVYFLCASACMPAWTLPQPGIHAPFLLPGLGECPLADSA